MLFKKYSIGLNYIKSKKNTLAASHNKFQILKVSKTCVLKPFSQKMKENLGYMQSLLLNKKLAMNNFYSPTSKSFIVKPKK